MNSLNFTLDKIKFATDKSTFKKAVELYESGKVTQVKGNIRAYMAVVIGSKPYQVSVDTRGYDYGDCTCYLGQNETLCKHMVALALYMVKNGRPLTEEDKKVIYTPRCSGKSGELGEKELAVVKRSITDALRYIKPYNGPSRTWFVYQNSLSEGCNRLAAIVSEIPVSEQTAGLLVDLLLRLDRKLCTGGVDDSDGTVGGFIEEVVGVLQKFAKLNADCVNSFVKLRNRETCFGWEEDLLLLLK